MVALLKGIVNGWRSIPSRVMAMGRQLAPAIKSGLGSLVSVGMDFIAGLWDGIKSKFDSVISRVSALADRLPTAVKKVLGIASPSKVMYKIGEYTGEGFALGIESMQRAVEIASLGLVNIPTNTMDTAFEYGNSASYAIEVPLYVNGREFARATAGDMSSVINQRETRQQRMRGIR